MAGVSEFFSQLTQGCCAMGVKAIFSDLDGTLVHFPAWFNEHGSRVLSSDEAAKTAVVESPEGERRDCRLLPSSTMGPGLVSEKTVSSEQISNSKQAFLGVVKK